MNQETVLEFPCKFPIKAMGINSDSFENEIVMIVRKHAPHFGEAAVKSTASKTGKYLSVTVTITAESKTQLDEVYREINSHTQVKMVL